MSRLIKLVPVVILVLLLVVLFFPGAEGSPSVALESAVSADPDITLGSSVQVTFPLSIAFNVTAQSDADIVRLRLHYMVDRQNLASVISEGWAQFAPTTSVNAQWTWDMRKSSLPPGARIQYWWTADDASGKSSQTSPNSLSFNDNRHTWQSITTNPVTLEWYNGSRSFADALMTSAQQGLARIENDTGAVPKGNVLIYIYASSQDLQSAQLFPPTWEGGVTFEGYDIIAIGVPTDQLAYGQRAVPHELTHWIVGQITFNSYGAGLPTWLDEGLATYGEGALNPSYQTALQGAIKNKQLISVRSLSSPFSPIPQEAYISYGESNSIVTFLIEKYGKGKMVELLDAFHKGAGYDEALLQIYSFDQDGLDSLWRQSLGISTAFAPQPGKVLAVSLAY